MSEKILKKYRKSKQRQRTLEILQSTEIHPTATGVYDRLKKERPTLSLGNVYRNLNILVEQGSILELKFGSTFGRYCANIKPHYHFICEDCGAIKDLDLPPSHKLNRKAQKMTNYKITNHRLEFFGLCDKCRSE
ncbi:transcriptional repressor [candidate division KSB1 bacterium]|nr:transcriptional repressor [candidate division KSB1 bacterium]